MAVELNTSGWFKPCADAYPSVDLLKGYRSRNVPVLITADAHEPDHLLRDFPRALLQLTKAEYDTVARFAERTITTEHAEAALMWA